MVIPLNHAVHRPNGLPGVLEQLEDLGPYWRQWGTGGQVLPQDHDTDAMSIFRWRRNG